MRSLTLTLSVFAAMIVASAPAAARTAQCVQSLNLGNNVSISYTQPCAQNVTVVRPPPVKVVPTTGPVTYYHTPNGTVTIIQNGYHQKPVRYYSYDRHRHHKRHPHHHAHHRR